MTDASEDDIPAEALWSDALLVEVKASLEQQVARFGHLPVAREDLVAEVLLRLISSDRRGVRSPLAYAATALRNLIRDRIRQLERAQRLFDGVARTKLPELVPTAERDALGESDLVERVLELADLTRTQRLVIDRMYFDGLTVSEVARALDKNPGTIQRHHDRALEKLSSCAARLERHP